MKFIHRLGTDAPLISDGALFALVSQHRSLFNALSAQDPVAAEHPAFKAMKEKLKPQAVTTTEGVRIIPIEGMLAHKPDAFEMLFGMEDTNSIIDLIESAKDDSAVKAIVLDIDSPGGFMIGGMEAAALVKAAAKVKPVVAWTGGLMASLAYMIGSQASVVVASPSAIVGSIGVFTTHVDWTKAMETSGVKVEVIKNKEAQFKAAGVMGTALTDEQRANIQERIQSAFGDFRRAVTSSRDVQKEAMQGQTFSGKSARDAGLVDHPGTKKQAIKIAMNMIR